MLSSLFLGSQAFEVCTLNELKCFEEFSGLGAGFAYGFAVHLFMPIVPTKLVIIELNRSARGALGD
jgi:hypothetical protein